MVRVSGSDRHDTSDLCIVGEVAGGGTGWGRGKTAASDQRIARAAAAHVGLTYQRRTPLELCTWPAVSGRPTSYEWTAAMAYAVGLLATDGCLIERARDRVR
jgi:hypothetical protein